MSAQATYDDVNLILRLYELRREDKLRLARDWFAANFKVRTLEDFNRLCPWGSEPNTYFRMVISYWDMAASFVTRGVLNQELFFESGGELLATWVRIRAFVPEVRATFKNPALWKNIETVALAQIDFMNRADPGAFDAIAAHILGPAEK